MTLPPLMLLASRPSVLRSVIDRRRVPALGALRPEGLAELRRDGAGPIVAHDAAIDTRGRHDAAGGGREENLVGGAQLHRRDRSEFRLDAQALAEGEGRQTRDPLERPAAGRRYHATG